jgi:hypothetical protein
MADDVALDLGAVAERIDARRPVWESMGWYVGDLSWKQPGWPHQPHPTEAATPEDYSVGVRVTRPDGEEVVWMVVFDGRFDSEAIGGWADLTLWDSRHPEDVIDDAPDLPDVNAVDALLDRVELRLATTAAGK